jgi:hypothetical protein
MIIHTEMTGRVEAPRWMALRRSESVCSKLCCLAPQWSGSRRSESSGPVSLLYLFRRKTSSVVTIDLKWLHFGRFATSWLAVVCLMVAWLGVALLWSVWRCILMEYYHVAWLGFLFPYFGIARFGPGESWAVVRSGSSWLCSCVLVRLHLACNAFVYICLSCLRFATLVSGGLREVSPRFSASRHPA